MLIESPLQGDPQSPKARQVASYCNFYFSLFHLNHYTPQFYCLGVPSQRLIKAISLKAVHACICDLQCPSNINKGIITPRRNITKSLKEIPYSELSKIDRSGSPFPKSTILAMIDRATKSKPSTTAISFRNAFERSNRLSQI